MKYIEKRTPPTLFQNYANRNHDNRTGVHIWNSFKRKEQRRLALHDNLLREQGYLCAYCGKGIGKEPPNDTFSIEHFEDKANHPNLTLEYTNLLGCCKDSQPHRIQLSDIKSNPKTFTNIADELAIGIEKFNDRVGIGDDDDLVLLGKTVVQFNRGIAPHCDDGKERRLREFTKHQGGEKVEQYLINPANDIDCETFFEYKIDDTGIRCEIIAVKNFQNTQRAENTIHVFNLNNENTLQKARADAAITARKFRNSPNIEDILETLYEKDENGRLEQYCFVTAYFLRKFL